MTTYVDPLKVIADAIATAFRVPEPITPSRWATGNLVVADGPRAGERWDPNLTPYVPDILDTLMASTSNRFAIRKSAQTGISTLGIAWIGYLIDREPARMTYVLPTIDALSEFNREKLTPAIEQTPALAKKVEPQTSRSAKGSTVTSKKFPRGSLVLINANSPAALRSKTLKIGVADEVDEWPREIPNQGAPLSLLLGRFMSFHAEGDWKLLELSTPTVLGESQIEEDFEKGDQRYWHVSCPQCGEEIYFLPENLRAEDQPPYQAHYIAQCCGRPIEHHEKPMLVRSGRFIATNPDGLFPSWHIDSLSSLLTTWDHIAEAKAEAGDDERKLKALWNIWFGRAYEVRGDAPDHERLMARREDYTENHVPPRGLILTAAADVQHRGIWVEIVAWAQNKENWCVSRRYLEGETTDAERGAFALLDDVLSEQFPDAFGGWRSLDAMAVDAGDGGRSNQVYQFCRARPKAFAIQGLPGWTRPAIGTPTKVDVTYSGEKVRRGATLWPIGTWSLKAEFYAALRKEGGKPGLEQYPPGFCHFGTFLDEEYFRQITSEYLDEELFRGRTRRVWKKYRENHLLDCRIYNMAMADYLGLTRLTPEEWSFLAAQRGVPEEARAADLLTPVASKPVLSSSVDAAPKKTKRKKKKSGRFARRSDW